MDEIKPAEQKEIKKAEGNVVKSPLVGTFYSASSPDSAPFVKVGDTVKKAGTWYCRSDETYE